MQQYVNNSCHSSFVYIHRNPSLSDIETILNAHHLLQDEVQTNPRHHSSGDRNCSSPEELCKDVNDHLMQRYVNNSCHPSFSCIYHNPSLRDIEIILNVLLWLHNEVLNTHYYQQCEYRICSLLLALCKDVDDHSMQRYVNNSSHSSFLYIHHNPSLSDIETILNALPLLQDEVQTIHHHQSSEDQSCSSPEEVCKDVNDHLMQQYVSNSCHPFFVYRNRNLFLQDIETILDVPRLLHTELKTIHHH